MMKKFPCAIFFIVGLFIVANVANGFGDTLYLTLDTAIELGLKNNKSLLIALEKVKEQSASKGIARAAFLPQINLSGTYTRLSKTQGFPMSIPTYGKYPFPVYDIYGNWVGFTESIPIITGAITETLEMVKQDNYKVGASVTQALFTWGKLLNAYKIAGLSFEMEKENYQKAIADLKLQITASFYQTILADKGAQLMNESYQQMERHIAQIEKLYQSGMVGQLDLLRAKVQLANIRSQMLRVENSRTIAYTALKTLLGIDEQKPIALKGDFIFEPDNIILDQAIDIALQERSDLKNMRRAVSIAQKGLLIQKTANLPTLFSAFNYDYSKPFSFTEEGWGRDWNVTLGISMPFFAGGANIYKIKQSQAQLKQAQLGLAMLEDGVKLEIKSLYLNLEHEKEILSYQAENVKTAEQALNLAEEKYQNGLITNLEYLDTQLALTQAKFDHLTSIANCIIAQAKLLNALGR